MARRYLFLTTLMVLVAALGLAGLRAAQNPDPAAGRGRGAGTGPAPAGQPQQPARGGGGGGGGAARGPAAPPAPDTMDGFVPIFDGTTLAGWDGDPRIWRAEGGIIVGESTPEKVITDNTFLIWRAGTLKDFELKIEARFAGNSGNSGIQIRSRMLTAPTTRSGGLPRPWGMAGYQVELTPQGGTATAALYEEGAGNRGFLAQQGQIVRKLDGGGSRLIGTLAENIPAVLKPSGEWNAFHIIARANVITIVVNGRMSAMVIDDDTKARSLEGLLGVQMHVGGPFRIEFRNVYYKAL